MSEKVEYVEVTVKVPKNVVKALREYVLKDDSMTEQEYWEKNAVGVVVADIECIASDDEEIECEPRIILEKYDLMKYHDRQVRQNE